MNEIQFQPEHTADAGRTLDAHRTAGAFDKLFGGRQPKAGSAKAIDDGSSA